MIKEILLLTETWLPILYKVYNTRTIFTPNFIIYSVNCGRRYKTPEVKINHADHHSLGYTPMNCMHNGKIKVILIMDYNTQG